MGLRNNEIKQIGTNEFCVLTDVRKIGGISNQYKLEVDIVKFNQYTRRKLENQFEVKMQSMAMIVDVPLEVGYDDCEQYISRYWNDFIKEGYDACFNKEFDDIGLGDKKLNAYQLYRRTGQDTRTFETIYRTFTYTCIKYDLKPSSLNLTYCIRAREGESGVLATYGYIQCKSEL